MKDPNGTRDNSPRPGSPPWIYMTVLIVAGLAIFAWAMTRLSGLGSLTPHALFWILAALMVVGRIRPIVTSDRFGLKPPVASVAFGFAALLYWGFPVAVLLRVTCSVAVAAAQRKAPHRCAFHAAVTTLSMAAAGLALAVIGFRSATARAPVISGADLPSVLFAGAAFFAVNFLLAGTAG